ncbi:MAG: hypothetical protein M1838_004406 [Thelocarpon superellum]|nr:MAG: hypothetical protein M1838_004406 [Thelocarpon superellum]
MRIRLPFAGAFLVLLLVSAYVGLTSLQITLVNDKVLHFVDFFVLTLCFYWVLDTTRRRVLNFTLVVCTAILGLGSEVVQGLLPNGRVFDVYDILANVLGSLAALALCSWYHKRMLDRKRQSKHYHMVPGEEEGGDVELGEGLEGRATDTNPTAPSLEAELDHWDENAEDHWDEDGDGETGEGPPDAKVTKTENGIGKTAEYKADVVS